MLLAAREKRPPIHRRSSPVAMRGTSRAQAGGIDPLDLSRHLYPVREAALRQARDRAAGPVASRLHFLRPRKELSDVVCVARPDATRRARRRRGANVSLGTPAPRGGGLLRHPPTTDQCLALCERAGIQFPRDPLVPPTRKVPTCARNPPASASTHSREEAARWSPWSISRAPELQHGSTHAACASSRICTADVAIVHHQSRRDRVGERDPNYQRAFMPTQCPLRLIVGANRPVTRGVPSHADTLRAISPRLRL